MSDDKKDVDAPDPGPATPLARPPTDADEIGRTREVDGREGSDPPGEGSVVSLDEARRKSGPQADASRSSPFNWIVNLDAGGDFRGAVEFMRWLEDGQGEHHFYGVHVPPEGARDGFETESNVRDMLAHDHSTEMFDSIMRTESSTRPSVVFSDFDTSFSAVLLLGRKEGLSQDQNLVDTSGMVRRLVEQTGMPVVVVPSDFRRDKMSTGPVMVAVDPHDTGSEVARFAKRLADCQRLPLLLVHVAQPPAPREQSSIDEIQHDYERAEQRAGEAMNDWARQAGVSRARRDVVRGDLRHGVQRTAGRHDASVVVVGTTASQSAQRLERPSEVFEIARFSHRPTALVPRGGDDDFAE